MIARIYEPASMPSPEFERFRYSFFEDPLSARDGLDLAALEALTGQEKAAAEDLLLQYLPGMRGVIGLGLLKSQRARRPLEDLLARNTDTDLSSKPVYLATALWQIAPDPRWLAVVTRALATAQDEFLRLHAAEALRHFRDAGSVAALTRALDDAEPLVRHHASLGLLVLHGLPPPGTDAGDQCYRIMSADADKRAVAKRDILDAIAGRPLVK